MNNNLEITQRVDTLIDEGLTLGDAISQTSKDFNKAEPDVLELFGKALTNRIHRAQGTDESKEKDVALFKEAFQLKSKATDTNPSAKDIIKKIKPNSPWFTHMDLLMYVHKYSAEMATDVIAQKLGEDPANVLEKYLIYARNAVKNNTQYSFVEQMNSFLATESPISAPSTKASRSSQWKEELDEMLFGDKMDYHEATAIIADKFKLTLGNLRFNYKKIKDERHAEWQKRQRSVSNNPGKKGSKTTNLDPDSVKPETAQPESNIAEPKTTILVGNDDLLSLLGEIKVALSSEIQSVSELESQLQQEKNSKTEQEEQANAALTKLKNAMQMLTK